VGRLAGGAPGPLSEDRRCRREAEVFRGIIEVLEITLAVLLAATIVLAAVRLAGLIYYDLVAADSIKKSNVLEVLDLILLLVLAIDILRTLVTAVIRRQFPIRIVIEAAMLAVLREIISVEIRKLDWTMLISLSIVFLILAVVWLVTGVMEKRGQVQEALGDM